MRAITLDDQKRKDLHQASISNPGVGLLCCTNFWVSARIPHPTPSGPPSPRGKGLVVVSIGLIICSCPDRTPKMRNDPSQLAVKPLTTAVRIIPQSAWVPSLVTSLSSRSRTHAGCLDSSRLHHYITIGPNGPQDGNSAKNVPLSLYEWTILQLFRQNC